MSVPDYWNDATRELAARDNVLSKLIARYSGLAMGSRGDAFSTLARAIVGQQISVKAAQSVWDRLTIEISAITPPAVVAAELARLRTCGLSGQKCAYLLDLAERFNSGALDPEQWHELDDEALIVELTQVKGIGRWTAEMFLIFYMARADVLPLDDIGLQRAMSLHYNAGRPLSKLKMRKIGGTWSPWRSVATWYLWRSLDPLPVQY
ncbi:MAG TPA: DNA-3-methyladenine glycosylase 2 family protein [Burkholderiales bacterium]|nr:DNA-3-methyladenine glycosylase 2 family protein [Burkholderiales bacterium]